MQLKPNKLKKAKKPYDKEALIVYGEGYINKLKKLVKKKPELKERIKTLEELLPKTRKIRAKKIKAVKIYKDELRIFPHPRSIRYIKSLSEVRGGSAGVKSAEAFEVIRHVEK